MSAVRISRYVFRRINGKIVPIRIGASRPPNAAIELAPPQKVKDYFDVGKDKSSNFFLQRKGSENSIGTVRKGFEKEDIGIKVKNENIILPDFAKYAFMNLKNIGYWQNKGTGTLALKNLRSSIVKETSIEDLFPSMKKERIIAEEKLRKLPSGISQKALKKLNAVTKLKKASYPKK